MATRLPPGSPGYDRHELTVENIPAGDADRIVERIERAPGVTDVAADADADTVSLLARDTVAVDDAEWVLDSLGYTLA